MSEKSQALASLVGRIRQQRPLVHHITNMVVMNDTANITLAIGASPVMAHALEEVEEMVQLARVLLLNIGTLTPEQIEAMLRAGKRANELGIPIVLDPVGAGATNLRTQSALRLLRELRISVIRGNASEVGTLVAAFLAVEADAWLATTAGLVAMGLAGEIAAPKAGGPGTFRSHLLDAVAALDEETIARGQKVSMA